MILLCTTEIASIDWSISIPIIVACLALLGNLWNRYRNEKAKINFELYKRKEEKYSNLIKALKGFYITSTDINLKNIFIDELNQLWMYCPDEIIKKAYRFIDTVHTDTSSQFTEEDKKIALGELILEMRKDLIENNRIKSTGLSNKDFKLLIGK